MRPALGSSIAVCMIDLIVSFSSFSFVSYYTRLGSGFDIFADEPRFPFVINATLSAGGLAVCLGLFYASILKAQAETEEDDKRYMSGR